MTEKWILRRAAERLLPPEIAWHPKLKFAHGCGLGDQLAQHAEETVTDADFAKARAEAAVDLRSKEEALYYRIFRDYFPEGVERLVGRSRSI